MSKDPVRQRASLMAFRWFIVGISCALSVSATGIAIQGDQRTPSVSLTGVVRDERGRPAQDVWVTAVAPSQAGAAAAERWPTVGERAQTDHRGEFRFYELPQGEFVVMVVSQHRTLPAHGGGGCGVPIPDLGEDFRFFEIPTVGSVETLLDGTGEFALELLPGLVAPPVTAGRPTTYVTTYAPDVTLLGRARRVRVADSVRPARANIALQLQRSARFAGRIEPGGQVALTLTGPSGTASTVSLPDGRFVFMDVPVGQYQLAAEQTDWSCDVGIGNPLRWQSVGAWQLGPTDRDDAVIHLGASGSATFDAVERIGRAPRQDVAGGASLTGRVLDSEGTPIGRTRLRLNAEEGALIRTTVANDAGRFTFVEVPGGAYTLTASHEGYPDLLYGQPHRLRLGTIIHLEPGEHLQTEFVMPPVGSISGTIRDESGKPVEGADVGAPFSYTETNRAGHYRIGGLVAGEHLVWAEKRGGEGSAMAYFPGVDDVAKATRVRVEPGQETKGIDLTLRPRPVTQPRYTPVVDGPRGPQIDVEPTFVFDASSSARPSYLRWDLVRAEIGGGMAGYAMVFADSKWVSRISLPAGQYFATAQAPGWHVRSAMLAGTDILDMPVAMTERNAKDLVVTLTDRAPRVTGIVHDGQGRATSRATVIVFSADPRFWTARSRRIRVIRPMSNGRYSVSGLPTGEYRVAAIPELPLDQVTDDKFLARLTESVRVALTEGTTTEADVQVEAIVRR